MRCQLSLFCFVQLANFETGMKPEQVRSSFIHLRATVGGRQANITDGPRRKKRVRRQRRAEHVLINQVKTRRILILINTNRTEPNNKAFKQPSSLACHSSMCQITKHSPSVETKEQASEKQVRFSATLNGKVLLSAAWQIFARLWAEMLAELIEMRDSPLQRTVFGRGALKASEHRDQTAAAAAGAEAVKLPVVQELGKPNLL